MKNVIGVSLGARRQDFEFRTTFLGAAVPASDLAGFLADAHPDVVVVSCTRVANLAGAPGAVAAAHGAGIPVVVGVETHSS